MKIIKKCKLESHGIAVKCNPKIAVSSPHIVQAMSSFASGNCCYLLSEYITGTNLAEEIHCQGPMNENVVQRLAAQIILGL